MLEDSGHDRSMTVYAPARDLKVPSLGVGWHTGTSQVMAIILS